MRECEVPYLGVSRLMFRAAIVYLRSVASFCWTEFSDRLVGIRHPISHSDAMGVAVRTLVLRGIWVLIRRFSAPIPSPHIAAHGAGYSAEDSPQYIRRYDSIWCAQQSNDPALSQILDNPLLFAKVATGKPSEV